VTIGRSSSSSSSRSAGSPYRELWFACSSELITLAIPEATSEKRTLSRDSGVEEAPGGVSTEGFRLNAGPSAMWSRRREVRTNIGSFGARLTRD
jgi:hypothetical protein